MKVLHSELLSLREWIDTQLDKFELEDETDTSVSGKETLLNIFDNYVNGLTVMYQFGSSVASIDPHVMVELFRDQLEGVEIGTLPQRKITEMLFLSKRVKGNPTLLTVNPPPAIDPDRDIYDSQISRFADNTSYSLQVRGLMMGERGIREVAGEFEVIHLRNVIGLIANPKYFIQTCYKSLKPGGKLIITEMDYNRQGVKDELRVNITNLINILSANVFTQRPEKVDYQLSVPYIPLTKVEIYKLLKNNNFSKMSSSEPTFKYVRSPIGLRFFEAVKSE